MRRPIGVILLLASLVMLLGGAGRRDVIDQPYVADQPVAAESQVDLLVLAKWKRLGIRPSPPCSDAVFLRRVFLDAIGTLPTAQEARAFLLDRDPQKRQSLIDRLLEREEFADYCALRWCDALRVKAEFPVNLWPNAAQAYHRFVLASVRQNKPVDQFARELLTATGSNFRVPEVNFYRAVQDRDARGIARTVALTFMGTRAERWPDERLEGMSAFFSRVSYKSTAEWKEEIVFDDVARAATRPAAPATKPAVLPDGTPATFAPDRDPRAVFADWLVSEKNPWFARAAVNRIWYWLLGRGIVHEPDDLRPDNPPANPELLTYLERQLVSHRWDLKHVYRLILNSRTYQTSSLAQDDRPEAVAQFAAYPIRRLDAEVLADALCQVSGTTERYTSPIPEPFTFIPETARSIELPDSSITSSFLELFGRPSRDTGLASERNDTVTAAQRLHLLNSSHVQRKIEQGKRFQALFQSKAPGRDVVNEMYLTILSRFPTEDELRTAEAYRSRVTNRREALVDLAWALINSSEFLYRH